MQIGEWAGPIADWAVLLNGLEHLHLLEGVTDLEKCKMPLPRKNEP